MAINKVVQSNGTTLIDITPTTAVASDVASGKIFFLANGTQATGTSSGAPSATSHTIYFEFSDETNTTITAYWDSSFISDAITATTPTTYGGKTVTLAQLDSVTWYEYDPTERWETVYENNSLQYNADQSVNYPYCWISSLSDVYPTVGSVWRITFNGIEYRCEAKNADNIITIGNPIWGGGTDDGSNVPFNFANQGWGAWTGNADLPNTGQNVPVKIERLMTA